MDELDFFRLLKGIECAFQLKTRSDLILHGTLLMWGEEFIAVSTPNEQRILFIQMDDISFFSCDKSHFEFLLKEDE